MAMAIFEFNRSEPRLKESEDSMSEQRRFERQRLVAAKSRYDEDPTPENGAALTDALDRFTSLVLRCV